MPTQVVHVSDGELIVLRKPTRERVVSMLGFGGFGVLSMIAARAVDPRYFWVPFAFGIICVIWGFVTSGPAKIKLDTHSGAFAVTTGPLLVAKTVRGSVRDIESLVFKVRSIETHGAAALAGTITVFSVRIDWKNPRRKSITVSNLSESDSYQMMSAIKARMDVAVRWDD